MTIQINWQYKDLGKLAEELRAAQEQSDDVAELAELYITLRLKLEAAEELKSSLQKMFDSLRFSRFPVLMDEKGISSFKTTEGHKLELTSDLRVSVLEENRPILFQWLRDHNSGDIIKETVNAATLQVMVRRMFKEGKMDELPVVPELNPEGEICYDAEGNVKPLPGPDGKPIPAVKTEPYSVMKLTMAKTK